MFFSRANPGRFFATQSTVNYSTAISSSPSSFTRDHFNARQIFFPLLILPSTFFAFIYLFFIFTYIAIIKISARSTNRPSLRAPSRFLIYTIVIYIGRTSSTTIERLSESLNNWLTTLAPCLSR